MDAAENLWSVVFFISPIILLFIIIIIIIIIIVRGLRGALKSPAGGSVFDSSAQKELAALPVYVAWCVRVY